MEENKKIKRIFTGKVVSDKMERTVVVETVHTYEDRRFHKIRRKTKKYKVHDEQGLAKVGDKVEFVEGRPVSKTKYMHLSRVLVQQV